jgi:hypothetical protein
VKRLIHILLIFTTLTAAALATVVFKSKWNYTMGDPEIPQSAQGLITEISMNVYNDWCGGLKCPDYEITFRRDGRETYYSRVTRTATRTGVTIHGDLSSSEFEQLAQLLESQRFFALQRVYPENSGCADCVIVRVSAVRDGHRKTVTDLYGEIPLELWTIQKVIDGTAADVQWLDKSTSGHEATK